MEELDKFREMGNQILGIIGNASCHGNASSMHALIWGNCLNIKSTHFQITIRDMHFLSMDDKTALNLWFWGISRNFFTGLFPLVDAFKYFVCQYVMHIQWYFRS